MSPRWAAALLIGGAAAHIRAALTLRRILRDVSRLDGDPDDCGGWCPVYTGVGDPVTDPTDVLCDDLAPLRFGQVDHRCELPAGHISLHSGDGYMWQHPRFGGAA